MSRSTLVASIAFFALFCRFAAAQRGPESVQPGSKEFREQVLISGLANPWEVTWGPDGMLWITERTGKRVTRVDPATGKASVAVTIEEVAAPGGQDGMLGLALDTGAARGASVQSVYVTYTYVDQSKGAVKHVDDPTSPYRYLYRKVVRLTYDAASGRLSDPVGIVAGLPAGNDHNAGRLKIGPDRKLYLTIGDMGNNQLGNVCRPIEAQRLPTRQELDQADYSSYVGKSLRMNLDGSIPKDNPRLAGVVSHVYTYGHRNPQGLDFGPDGTLYSSEHGPKTDDEVNILRKGGNYGWPHVAGLKDGKAYEYARWAEASTPCAELTFSDLAIHPSVPREPESAFTKRFHPPIATLFTVPSGYNFQDPACEGIHYICWPTVGVSSIEHYANNGAGIPGWDRVLLATALKRGSLYVLPLDKKGRTVTGAISRYFQSENRFRDTAVSPDGKTIYIAMDSQGLVEAAGGGVTRTMRNPGAILAFTYDGEGDPALTSGAKTPAGDPGKTAASRAMASGPPATFTAAQAAEGKTAYNSRCAVCHGSNLVNGTFGTPLAGSYFQTQWAGRAVRALFDHSKTMPPSEPASLPDATYAAIVAYILEVNGLRAGDAPLPPADRLGDMAIR